MMKKAFTLMELMVAVGILAIVLSFAGIVFNASIDTHRTARANSEIMQKLRAITNQLDADFAGLRKDGEIFVTWVASLKPGSDPLDPNSYERLDRIMFFADGDFQSYGTAPAVRGKLARICYMLATKRGVPVDVQSAPERILSRSQHIITFEGGLPYLFMPGSFTDIAWRDWNNVGEYDKMTLEQWKKMPRAVKDEVLSVITDVVVGASVPRGYWGTQVHPADANTIHNLLCEGVGEFKIQGWYDLERRWVPQVDPDGDGSLGDSDLFLPAPASGPIPTPGVLYPNGGVNINGIGYARNRINEANFNNIPGLGRAFKFTFTLFDSKGVIKNGRTFTHIVYLDK